MSYCPLNVSTILFFPTLVCLQGGIATFLTMPLDVMKTRMMNAAPGTYKVSAGGVITSEMVTIFVGFPLSHHMLALMSRDCSYAFT